MNFNDEELKVDFGPEKRLGNRMCEGEIQELMAGAIQE
jgi:hypothetical protein